MDAELNALSRAVGEALTARGWMLVTAESCTGGWVAEAVTAISGSSAWLGPSSRVKPTLKPARCAASWAPWFQAP